MGGFTCVLWRRPILLTIAVASLGIIPIATGSAQGADGLRDDRRDHHLHLTEAAVSAGAVRGLVQGSRAEERAGLIDTAMLFRHGGGNQVSRQG